MKKLLVLILSVVAAFAAILSLTACDNKNDNGGSQGGAGKPSTHYHSFTEERVEENYLKSAATCTAKAVYYYSCECGEKGTQTFEYGDKLPHEYNDSYICTNCSYKCKSDGLSFALSTDNNSYVCTGLGTFDGKILIIPSEYNGKPVTKIEEDAFKNATGITDVLIPDSVTEVGFNAFGGCCNLTKLVLPFVGAYADGSGDENIGYIFGASSYSEQGQKLPLTLKTIVLSDKVTKIGSGAFSGCRSLTSVTIPDGVTSIGWGAFEDCRSLTSVTIGNGVTSIGSSAFTNCTSLTSVTIPDNVTSIGDYAFSGCSLLTNINVNANNQNYKSIDGNLYSKDGKTLIQYAIGKTDASFVVPDSVTSIGSWVFSGCRSLTSVTIPDGVTSIEDYAFSYCSKLTSVTIGNGVTSIGRAAFEGCSSLTSVTIGDGVTSIGDSAFNGCRSLTRITVNANNQNYKSIDGNLYSKDGKTLIQYAIGKTNTSFIIPDGVTSIGEHAFCNCESLTSVTIPDSVTSIGDLAFYYCTSLKTINYKGGKEQWVAISKGLFWDLDTGNYTINYNYVEN